MGPLPLRRPVRRRVEAGTPVLRRGDVYSVGRVWLCGPVGGAVVASVSPAGIRAPRPRVHLVGDVLVDGDEGFEGCCGRRSSGATDRGSPGASVEVEATLVQWAFASQLRPRCSVVFSAGATELGEDVGLVEALYRRAIGGCDAAVSRWATVQVHGSWLRGGRSGGFPRRRRRGWPDSGLKIHGDNPRSTLHIDRSSADGGELIRLTKPLDGDGVSPAFGAQVARLLSSR